MSDFRGIFILNSYLSAQDRMGRQVIRAALLFALLAAPGFAQSTGSSAQEQAINSCSSAPRKLLSFVRWDRDRQVVDEIPIWQLPDSNAFFFISGMMIDADGAPNAYHPDDTGLDELANAGSPSHWDGIVTDEHGKPLLQLETDPFPGYYISCTSLADRTKTFSDPGRYVDSTEIPYIALPAKIAERARAHLGDFAFVVNLRNGKSSFAIYADIGALGEGSVALAKILGISPNARQGGESDGVLYMLFPGSGNLRPRTVGEIQREGERLLSDSGGIEKIFSCSDTSDDPAVGKAEF
jgi:hypothetical protein